MLGFSGAAAVGITGLSALSVSEARAKEGALQERLNSTEEGRKILEQQKETEELIKKAREEYAKGQSSGTHHPDPDRTPLPWTDLLDTGGLPAADLMKCIGLHAVQTKMRRQMRDRDSQMRLTSVSTETISTDPDALIALQTRINAAITRLGQVQSDSHSWDSGKNLLKTCWWFAEGLQGCFGMFDFRRILGAIIGIAISHFGTSKLAEAQQEEIARLFASLKSELEAKGKEVTVLISHLK